MTLPSVVEAKHDGRSRIRLVFEDTTTKTVDFRPWLKGPVFEALKDVKYARVAEHWLFGATSWRLPVSVRMELLIR